MTEQGPYPQHGAERWRTLRQRGARPGTEGFARTTAARTNLRFAASHSRRWGVLFDELTANLSGRK